MKFLNVNGLWVLQAPEGAEDSAASGGPAGEDAGSEGESEFEEMHEAFESDSNDEAEEESESESDVDYSDEAAQDKDEPDAAEEELDADEEDEADDEGDEKEEEPEDDEDDEGEEQPQEMTSEQLQEARNQFMEGLAEQFEISDEEADMLRVEPEKALPKLLARATTQAVEYAVNIMRQNMPTLVGTQVQQQAQAQEVQSKFFGKFPELNNKKAVKVATQVAKTYRQLNPDASVDEVMDNVAYLTYRKMGLPMDQLMEKLSDEQEEFRPSQVQKKQKQGFKPANAGKQNAAATRQHRQDDNEFAELANLLNDDSYFDED